MAQGRLYFNDTLRRPGKVPDLAMGYSMTVPLAREFRDAYRELYWDMTLLWIVGYNPQRLLTDQREDRTEEVLESLFDNGLLHLGANPFTTNRYQKD